MVAQFIGGLPEHILILGIISMACRALQEITKWRRLLSYLPDWVFSTGGWMNLDGYHIITTIHWLTAVAVGQELALYRGERLSAEGWFWVWFWGGQFSDIFYHVVWMRRPEFWMRDWWEGMKAAWRWLKARF